MLRQIDEATIGGWLARHGLTSTGLMDSEIAEVCEQSVGGSVWDDWVRSAKTDYGPAPVSDQFPVIIELDEDE